MRDYPIFKLEHWLFPAFGFKISSKLFCQLLGSNYFTDYPGSLSCLLFLAYCQHIASPYNHVTYLFK